MLAASGAACKAEPLVAGKRPDGGRDRSGWVDGQAADPTKPALASSVSLRDCSYDPGPWSRRDHTGLTLAHVRWTRNGSAPPEPVSIADVFKICPNATKACVILTTKLDKRCQYC